MQRELKFRVWDKEDKRMITHEQDFIPLKVCSLGVLRLNPTTEKESWHLLPIERFEVMQYTGLTDKNGVEIYDGDILKCDGLRIVIQYSGCAFEGRYLGAQKDLWSPIRNNNYLQWEVIGNIHQNPELLNQ